MLRGIYRATEGPAVELRIWSRLKAADPASRLTICGRLAVASSATSATVAQVDHVTCVLEGALYDPAVLSRELTRFPATHPATHAELVARSYRRLGIEALARLRGRYVLVIWDELSRRGVLASDLLATRQLFMRRAGGGLVFASELHELLRILPSRPGPDPVVALKWLIGASCPVDRTLYEGISRLSPGNAILLQGASVERRCYWRPSYDPPKSRSRVELADGLRDLLLHTTERRLSEESNGVILSGGVDSSIVTATARMRAPAGARLATYSAVFPGQPYDESAKIRSLTSALEIDPSVFRIEPQGCLRHALSYTAHWEVPLVGMAAITDGSLTAQAARDGIEIVLDGQTGDEVLGFAPYLIADRLRRGRLLSALRLIWHWPGGRPRRAVHWLRLLTQRGAKAAVPYRLIQTVRARRDADRMDPPWLLANLRRRLSEIDDNWAWLRGSGPLWWRFLTDELIDSPHRELRIDYLRHRATTASVINESPLYDPDLIEYSLSLPPECGFDPRFDRSLARDAMRGLLPEEVRTQPSKANMSSFCHDALTGEDAAGIGRLLTAADAEIGAYVDLDWVRRTWDATRSGAGGASWWILWWFASFECWLRLQTEPRVLDEMLADPSISSVRITQAVLSA